MCVFDLRIFGHTSLQKIINIEKIVRITMRNSAICDFRMCLSKSQCSMGILFSFYAILSLHSAFRNVTPRIEGPVFILLKCVLTLSAP